MCFSSTPVPPTAAKIFVLSNSDSVVRNYSEWFSPVKRQNSSACEVGQGWCPTGTRWVYHWDTVRAPLGHGACPAGTWCVSRWDTVCDPLGHGRCTTGARSVYHWGTVGVPLGHGRCTTGARCVYHWGTVGVPLGYGGCPTGGCIAPSYSAVEAYRAIVILKLSARGSGSIRKVPLALSSPDRESAPALP